MTDAEKIEQVEQALDGTRELIAEVRTLANDAFNTGLSGREMSRMYALREQLGHAVFDPIWEQQTLEARDWQEECKNVTQEEEDAMRYEP